jgi:hypothetical protein
MGDEHWLRARDPQAYRTLRPTIAEWLRARPSYVAESGGRDFLLKDPSNAGGWDHDVRIMLEPAAIYVLVSMRGVALSRDVRALHEWLRQRTPIELVDDAGEPIEPVELFGR